MGPSKIAKIILLAILLFITISSVFCETLAEPPANFTETDAGTADNPYQIATLANLRWFSETSNWGYNSSSDPPEIPKHFIQTADIDASDTINWNWGRGFKPVGCKYYDIMGEHLHPFMGKYNGQNYIISNLYTYTPTVAGNDPPYLPDHYLGKGMFGTTYKAVLTNIRLENASFNGRNVYYTGVLCGLARATVIQNCHTSGTLSITGGGGLIGKLDHSVIEYCSSIISGDVRGCLVQSALDETDNLYPSGNLFYNRINNSYARGTTQGNGGLFGLIIAEYEVNKPEINNVYITNYGTDFNNNRLAGTLSSSIFTNSFWNIETTEVTDPFTNIIGDCTISNIYGLTTAEMKNPANYIANGWDFENIWAIDPDINDGYPYLRHDTIAQYLDDKDITIAPVTSQLLGNYPNPFNPVTTIRFAIAKDSNVSLDIYNIKGQLVRSLVNAFYKDGTHNVIWNGTDNKGEVVSSGVYFYRLNVGEYSAVKKMLLMK